MTRLRASIESLDRRDLPLYVLAGCLVLVLFGLRLIILKARFFNPDEFQHLHSAWSISKGLLPYRDYFDHHTPWLHFFLASFFPLFDVDQSFAESLSFIFFARLWMWLGTGAILILTLSLGRSLYDWRAALVATLLLSNTLMFLAKSIEIRPDVPAVAFLMASLLLTVKGLRLQTASTARARVHFASSGACLGAAIMCSQKILFVMPGFALSMLWYLLDRRSHGKFRDRALNGVLQVAALCLPIALTVAYFAAREGLGAFIEYNLLMNLRWKTHFPPYGTLSELTRQNPFFVSLAMVGFLAAFARTFGEDSRRRGHFVLVLSTLALFVGMFKIPTPYRQYTLMFLPLAGILAGGFLVHIIDHLSESVEETSLSRELLWLVPLAGTLWHFVGRASALLAEVPFYRIVWLVVLLLATGFVVSRRKPWALATILIGLSIYPISQLRFGRSNRNAVTALRFVMENTTPDDTVMDGFTGFGVFRRHAYFYYAIHSELRRMLTAEERRQLLFDLETGRIAPHLIFMDRDLRGISAEVTAFFEANYEPASQEPVWKRKEIWIDGETSADRKLDFGHPPARWLVGPGWREAETDDGITYRLSRGRRSWLRIPIRTPTDLDVTIRARLEYLDHPLILELAFNGEAVGKAGLQPGWREYVFSVPRRLVNRGVNSLVLTYSATPRSLDPQHRGPNAVIAVDWLGFRKALPRQ